MKSTIGYTEESVIRAETKGHDFSQAIGIRFIVAIAGLAGVWGVACMVSILANVGLLSAARAWISAISGV
ncbi:MAG: hypothetical protein ACLFV2_04225 [Desulfurivibrionaceae bacterium]